MNIQRQLKDIVLQGERFKNIDLINAASVEEFSQYAQEIKSYLQTQSKNKLIMEKLIKINEISFHDVKMPIWLLIISILFLPYLGFHYLKEYQQKIECKNAILETTSLFASIEFLSKNEAIN